VSVLEHPTVPLPGGPLDPAELGRLLDRSRGGPGRGYGTAREAFLDLAEGLAAEGASGP